MLNYIRSEFYRILRNTSSYLFIIACALLLTSANVLLAAIKASDAAFPYASTGFTFSMFYSNLIMVLMLCIGVASLIFGNEHNNHTMKNSISYGISRGQIFFGKLVVELVYSLVAFLIITGVDIGTAYLLLEDSGIGALELTLKACFVALPLLLFAIAATNCFLFTLESTGSSVAATIGLLLALPLVCNLLGMKFKFIAEFAKLLPYNMINNMVYDFDKYQLTLPWAGSAGYRNYWLIGLIELVLITLIGYVLFKKKEVK